MRRLISNAAAKIAAKDYLWRLVDGSLLRVAHHLQFHRDLVTRDRDAVIDGNKTDRLAHIISPNLRVRHGLFAGMQYPSCEAYGSSFLPKLLGSYERELQPMLETLISNRGYRNVIDIGCAEGYYAVGLARAIPDAHIYAFDISETARKLCQRMADINGVGDRVSVNGWFDLAALNLLELTERTLLIADCEGYESQLFTRDVAQMLGTCDVIVELHDDISREASSRIETTFSRTHEITSIAAVYDAIKTRVYKYPELDGMGDIERRFVVSENRSTGIEWFVLTSLTSSSDS